MLYLFVDQPRTFDTFCAALNCSNLYLTDLRTRTMTTTTMTLRTSRTLSTRSRSSRERARSTSANASEAPWGILELLVLRVRHFLFSLSYECKIVIILLCQSSSARDRTKWGNPVFDTGHSTIDTFSQTQLWNKLVLISFLTYMFWVTKEMSQAKLY